MEEGRGQDGHVVNGQLRSSGGAGFQWRSPTGVADGSDSATGLLGFGGDSLESPTSFHFSVAPTGIPNGKRRMVSGLFWRVIFCFPFSFFIGFD